MTETRTPTLEEKSFHDAPAEYSSEEAGAWASGYNSCLEDAAALREHAGKASDAIFRLTAALASLREERDALRAGIRDAYAEYEKHGAISTFEGCDMIYASTLEDLFTLTESKQ